MSENFFLKKIHKPCGFTLIEMILAIVIIGVALPSIMVPFSGIEDIKHPEYTQRATWLGMYQMEAIASETSGRMPAAGNYSCAAFVPTVGSPFAIDCSLDSTEYSYNWVVDDVDADDPDTGGGSTSFGKKVTLQVSRVDGALGTVEFHAFF